MLTLALTARQFVDRKVARKHCLEYALYSEFCDVAGFQSASGKKPATGGGENYCVKKWPVVFVEGTVDEYGSGGFNGRFLGRGAICRSSPFFHPMRLRFLVETLRCPSLDLGAADRSLCLSARISMAPLLACGSLVLKWNVASSRIDSP